MKAGNKLPRDVTGKRTTKFNFSPQKVSQNCENHQHAYENYPLKDQLPDLEIGRESKGKLYFLEKFCCG
jgi:hypothetical protein